MPNHQTVVSVHGVEQWRCPFCTNDHSRMDACPIPEKFTQEQIDLMWSMINGAVDSIMIMDDHGSPARKAWREKWVANAKSLGAWPE